MYIPPCCPGQEVIGILIPVPEPWVSQLATQRQRFGDPLGGRIPPHVTLLPPTTVPCEDDHLVIEHLRAVAAEHRPFEVELSGAGTFRPVSPVAYLQVAKGAAELTELEADLRAGVLDLPSRFPYHPHVTLAQQVPDDQLDRALDFGRDFHARWTVNGFRLDRVSPDGVYHSRAIFSFDA